jgi:hypothetical protein
MLFSVTAGGTLAARPAPVTGKLNKPGYTLVALGYDGRATSVRARGSFRLVPPGARFTLQLRNKWGKYAGGVVVGGTGSRVIVGLKAGAKLGVIKVLKGYARPAKPVPARFVDRKRTAQARKGVPRGNGRNFGLVRSSARGPSGAGGDSDRDGAPNAFDIDVDGDVILNPFDSSSVRSLASNAQGPAPASGPSVFSQLFLNMDETVNANASAASVAQIDSTVAKFLNIKLAVPQGELMELDCGGLVYCSPGGTGITATPPEEGNASLNFPACCDPDGNGFGNLRGPGAAPLRRIGEGDEFSLNPSATSTQIGSGDAWILRTTSAGVATQTPVTLPFVFITVPALARYDDGAGSAATVSYPVPAGGPGTPSNPIAIGRNTSGDYVFTMTLFRPQRRGIASAGEASYMDLGRLRYAVQLPNVPGQAQGSPGGPTQCSQASLSTSDPNLTSVNSGDSGMLADQSGDKPADPANTLTFSVNLSKCVSDKGGTLEGDRRFHIHPEAFASGTSSDHALQTIYLETK